MPLVRLVNNRAWAWFIIALLAVYSLVDFALQYVVAATSLPQALQVPQTLLDFLQVCHWLTIALTMHVCMVAACTPCAMLSCCLACHCNNLQDVVGISVDARGWALTRRLLRAASLLGLIYVYRFGYSLGVLQAQLEDERMSDMQRQHSAMRAQRGLLGCVRRVLILQSPALLATACVGAALADQGAIGLCLVAAVSLAVVLSCSGRGASWAMSPALLTQRMLRVVVAGSVACVALAWLLCQYAVQVSWLRSMLQARAVAWLTWAGLTLPPLPVDVDTLERGLRFKTGMLVAVTLLTAAAGYAVGYAPLDTS